MKTLIPKPHKTETSTEKLFHLPDHLAVSLGEFEPWCVEGFRERTGLSLLKKEPWLLLQKDAVFSPEGYRLTVEDSRVKVYASEERGVVWALTSLYAMLWQGMVTCCDIEDVPRFAHRGISLDCARHFFDAEEMKRVIEGLSLAKINVLHWHLADDQAWRIESKVFPQLQATSDGFYTQEQLRDVVDFAYRRGVEIIPEIDMPGHTSAILAALPELGCFGKKVKPAKSGGIYPVILCPGKEETFEFVEKLLEELIPLFPGDRFHIGGDEAPKSEWAQCPHCRARMEKLGITEPEDLQGYFTARVVEMLKKHGKTAVCWNETLLSANYPEDIQIQYWTLRHRESMKAFADKGGKYIYSEMFELYLDYPHGMTPLKKIYKTVPKLNRKPIGMPENLLGLEACLWTEHVYTSERFEQLLFPRAIALAELAWSGGGDYTDFKDRLVWWAASPINAGLAFTPPEMWDPKGKKRQVEAVAFFEAMTGSMPEDVREQTMEAAAPSKEYVMNFIRNFLKITDIPVFLKILRRNS